MKYIEANTKGYAIVKKFSEQLRGYGYTDVIFRKYPSKVKPGDYALTNSIHLYFWNASHGYLLSITEKNRQDLSSKMCDFDSFISVCEKIVSFAKNVTVLESDYTNSFGEFLERQGILNLKVGWPRVGIDSASVSFYNEQY